MQRRGPTVVFGAAAGVIAGATVMLWFFVLDVLAGQPLATPTLLAEIILDRQVAEATLGLVAAYTLLHYAIFVALGVAGAVALRETDTLPQMRHGLVFGVGVLNAVHYGALLATDAAVMSVLPDVHVVAANLLGGVAGAAFLHYTVRAPDAFGLGVLRENRLVEQGLKTGLLGAAAVAVWFFLFDIFAGRPFFTPAALGSATFLGTTGEDAVGVSLGVIASYTVIHVIAFAVVGVGFVWISERVENTPGLWLAALMGFIVVEAGFIAVTGVVGGWVLGSLGWLTVGVANLLAVSAMGWYVWTTHPGLRRNLMERPVATMV